MPQISVIIPVYNVEPYLEKCVRSVLDQTFSDIEVICVDNGSTDGSLALLRQLAAQDNRVRVFEVKNLGPGHSRNLGLDEARGTYILFVDSDDFVAPELCEVLLQHLQREKLDIAACEFYAYHNDSAKAEPALHPFELPCKYDLDAAGGDSVTDFANFAFASPFVWGKLFRRELIEKHHVRFPLGAVEDVPFVVACLTAARRVKRYGDLLYYYRVGRPDSISGRAERMVLDGIKNFAWLEQKLRESGVFEQIKETFWFNQMVLLIGDEHVFAGRLGNVPLPVVQKAYDAVGPEVLALEKNLFIRRNAWFNWKVHRFRRALKKKDLTFPRRLRKLRNLLMIFLNPYYKLKSKLTR